MVMAKYKPPSESAFRCRKLFHSTIKDISESSEQWFDRIQQNINGCDFGTLSDIMLIDKFISGLSDHFMQEISKKSTLTIAKLLSILKTTDDDLSTQSIFVNNVKKEPLPTISEFLSLEIVKDENDCGTTFETDCLSVLSDEVKTEINEKIPDDRDEDAEEDVKPKNNEHNPFGTELKGSKLNAEKHTVCLDCGKVFVLRCSYIQHRRIHTGNKLQACQQCNKLFITRSKLKAHMSTHLNDGRSFECYLCPFKFDRWVGLRLHFTAKHSANRKEILVCTYCDKKFVNEKKFSLHVRVHQGLTEAHKCPQCNKTFDSRSQLLMHTKIHLEFKEFVCETCGKSFTTRKGLRNHNRKHTNERPYKCGECGLSMKTTFTYKNHMRQHTGERPFNCEICAKTFVSRSNWRKHMMVHRQERPHACKICDKRFATAYDTKLHMSVHTGIKPYKCDMCDKAFTQPVTLRVHKAKIHTNYIANP